jgi:hypothetical protein
VQIGKENLAFAQALAFHGLRFLDLHDHVGLGKDFLGRRKDLGTGGDIVGIGKASTRAGQGFDHNRMAVVHGFADGIRGHPHAEFLRLDLFRATDLHFPTPIGGQSHVREVWRISMAKL